MQEINVEYNGERVKALLLATFTLEKGEVVQRKIFLFKRDFFVKQKRSMALVFLPYKDALKEIAIVLIKGGDIPVPTHKDTVMIDAFISAFTKEEPYRAEYSISDYIGLKCFYERPYLIADIINGIQSEALEVLYNLYPEFLE